MASAANPGRQGKEKIVKKIEHKVIRTTGYIADKLFHGLWVEAIATVDRDEFVSDWSLSRVWDDAPDADIPADRIDVLARIWDAAHLTIRDIRAHTGLSQAAFATRYCIPIRTVEDWERGVRSCPDYLRLLLAESAGVYKRP